MNFDWFKYFAKLSLEKIYIVFGILLFILAFYDFTLKNGKPDLSSVSNPNWWFLIVGLIIVAFGLIRSVFSSRKLHTSVKKLSNGFRMKVSTRFYIDLINDSIENIDKSFNDEAIVLPANTCFDDECIKDTRSALGAFLNRHFPTAINELQTMISEKAEALIQKDGSSNKMYPAGTTILLEKPLGSQFKILITAVTDISSDNRIKADTISVVAAIKEVCKLSASKRISGLRMPVIGTGHGGLDFSASLSLILLQVVQSVIHEGCHYLKNITIVVYDPNNERQKEVHRIVNSISKVIGR